jgi:hypothetical protein
MNYEREWLARTHGRPTPAQLAAKGLGPWDHSDAVHIRWMSGYGWMDGWVGRWIRCTAMALGIRKVLCGLGHG